MADSHSLRRQPLDQPTSIGLASVTKAIVQAVRSALPKFDRIRFHSIPAPMRRQRNALVTEAFGHLRHSRIQHAAAINHLALARRPCAQLTTHRTRMKIGLRFFARSLFRLPANANLTIQFDPVKCQRSVRVGIELLSFFALVVGKKRRTRRGRSLSVAQCGLMVCHRRQLWPGSLH